MVSVSSSYTQVQGKGDMCQHLGSSVPTKCQYMVISCKLLKTNNITSLCYNTNPFYPVRMMLRSDLG